jgi:hypothetical protein
VKPGQTNCELRELDLESPLVESLGYTCAVRRLLSITLLLLFGLPLIAPFFALGATAESQLPACCRSHGAHHCVMSAEQLAALEQGQQVHSLQSQCPMFPRAVAPSHVQPFAYQLAASFDAGVLSQPAKLSQIEAWARVALDGARHKRGPPMVRLS